MKRNPPFRWEVSMAANTLEQTQSVDDIVRNEVGARLMDFVSRLGKKFLPQPEPEVSKLGLLPFLTLSQLQKLCEEQPINYVVEGLLPSGDVHIAVGDSGLGKTA